MQFGNKIGFTNAVNLTDGIDGLAASVTVIVACCVAGVLLVGAAVAGVVIMLTYAVTSYIRLRLHIRDAARQEGRIWVSDKCHTPFIIGIINPKIILPESIDSNECEYVIAHEKAHLKRFDHITKPLGFALLCIYWFNPLLWVAYILLSRDILSITPVLLLISFS